MNRDVLLVGSVGLANADDVFRTTASILGDLAPRLTDGETGWARSVWIQCQRPFFMGNPALEMVEQDPDHPNHYRPARVPSAGIYGHTFAESYRGRARLRPGVAASDIRFDNLGYSDWAQESYELFARLKSEGVIPTGTKFQVCVPAPSIILNAMVWPDAQPDVAQTYQPAHLQEIKRMLTTMPPEQLAIQWDCWKRALGRVIAQSSSLEAATTWLDRTGGGARNPRNTGDSPAPLRQVQRRRASPARRRSRDGVSHRRSCRRSDAFDAPQPVSRST